MTAHQAFSSSLRLYRSPSQTKDQFESFLDNLKLNLDTIVAKNPYLVVIIGYFNIKLKTGTSLGKLLTRI